VTLSKRAVLITLAVSVLIGCSDEDLEPTYGTIVGLVSTELPTPDLPDRSITKDTEVCGSESRPSQAVIADGAGGLKNVVLSLRPLQGTHLPPPQPQDAELTFDRCEFAPHVQSVSVGTTLAITNGDPLLHNSHAYLGEDTLFNLALPIQGQTIMKMISEPGIVRVQCDVGHSWESAWIVVHLNDFTCVTASDGSFRIDQIPTGRYELTAWHEYFGTQVRSVRVREGEPLVLELMLSG